MNEYNGATVTTSFAVPKIDDSVGPSEFYKRFVQTRTPCIITGGLSDAPLLDRKHLTNDFLKKTLEGVEIDVEHSQETQKEEGTSQKRIFGRGKRVRMLFSEILDRLSSGDTSLYISTQEIDQWAVVAPPTSQLAGEGVFPERPKLVCTLVPYQYNIWMGCSPDGSSTGLHHDYHDNLYFLLQGKKQFRLFSPKDALKLYTYGKIRRIHKNGLIEYEGEPFTRPDGLPLDTDYVMAKAEEQLRDAEAALDRAERKGDKRAAEEARAKCSQAEAVIEQALDVQLNAEALEYSAEEEEDIDFGAEETQYWGKQLHHKGNQNAQGKQPATFSHVPEEGEREDTLCEPNHFSRVDLSASTSEVHKAFPMVKETTMTECEIQEGEILYLPAGWFHEVTSFGGFHFAFNYWFWPPSEPNQSVPYADAQWEENYATAMARESNAHVHKKQRTQHSTPPTEEGDAEK